MELWFDSCKTFPRTKELAACVTAYIELHGVSAIDEIETVWLNSDNRPVEEIQLVFTALLIQQKCGNRQLRERISRCLEKAKGNSVEIGGAADDSKIRFFFPSLQVYQPEPRIDRAELVHAGKVNR